MADSKSVDEFTTGVPAHEELKQILNEPSAPPRLVLDLGGSKDLDADGLVSVSLDADGELVFEDV